MVNYHKLGDTELAFTNKLGVTRDIKRAFGKEYTHVVQNADKLTLDEVIKFIYTCQDEKGDLKEFTEWVYEESGAGHMDVIDLMQELVMEIQFPGKTPEERKKIMMEKEKEHREMTSSY